MSRRTGRRGSPEGRRLRPRAEGLEDRLLLYATMGGNWAFGSRITYSFAPDGTSVGGIPSAWFQRMSDLGFTEKAWKDEFRKAAATWQAVAGINLVEVPDNGAAFSISGYQQNDPRFGDIRIAGTDQGTGVLGGTFQPPPFNGGTLAGDIVMNTAAAWKINGTYDLQTVAIHEIGHALGLDHSAITSAVMYSYYTSQKQTLDADDTSGIRAVYGPHQPDFIDAAYNNGYYYSATNVNPIVDGNGQVRLGDLDITYTGDADWFYVTAPANTTGTMTATVQATGLSSLSPKVVVYTGSMQGLGMASADYSYGGSATFTVTGVTPGQSFYVRAQSAHGGPSGNGAYGLLINFGSQPIAPIPPPDTTVAEQFYTGGDPINLAVGPDLPPGIGVALAHANPNARGLFRKVDGLDTTDGAGPELLRIGDLVGFGSELRTDPGQAAGAEAVPMTQPRARAADPTDRDGLGVYVVLPDGAVGTDLAAPGGRGRERALARVIDRVLDAWDGIPAR